MQRSLLPRAQPHVAGLELGEVYESSARVDVGGDVYDFLELDDGRLAVVLGDVTGHGVEATADMAMAKFVFRSLAREHPEPGDFLAARERRRRRRDRAGQVHHDGVPRRRPGARRGRMRERRPSAAAARAARTAPSHGARGARARARDRRRRRRTRRCAPRSRPARSIVLYTDGVDRGAARRRALRRPSVSTRCSPRTASWRRRARATRSPRTAARFAGGELTDDLAVVVDPPHA